MTDSLIVLASLIGIVWLGIGRPKLPESPHLDYQHHHHRSLGHKVASLGALALGSAWLARHELVVVGLTVRATLLPIGICVIVIRGVRRRQRRHTTAPGQPW